MAHCYTQGLLLLVLLIVISECRAVSPEVENMVAYKDGDKALPCFNPNATDSKSCYRVKWTKYATDARQWEVILAWPKKSQDSKRATWGPDGGQMSLLLTKIQKSDEGLYSCEICYGWDCTVVKNISLKVKDCKVLHAVRISPGKPIKINCPVNTTLGQERPQNIFWAVLKGGKPQSVDSERVHINDTSLAILSDSTNDSGWYRCSYIQGQTQRCFDIKILVQVEGFVEVTTVPIITTTTQKALTKSETVRADRKEESRGTFIAPVAAVTVGAVIIAALIGVFVYRRHNTQRITQQSQRKARGALAQSVDSYENVTLGPSYDPSNQRVNSLYQHFEGESMFTFHY
ncbi:uncharacterized protein LOC108891034 isoform X2 [Lates calcarifer]|uniref:Uncharacterized protein LOC108891034 isoform X2 n=1 Tax=Lates calcarifer TaxID=8187 RepID=A0AAJ7VAM6_LATCA|nr:uncharacterized protein LOC108891034 isoform X2 [Lates calcarifer]